MGQVSPVNAYISAAYTFTLYFIIPINRLFCRYKDFLGITAPQSTCSTKWSVINYGYLPAGRTTLASCMRTYLIFSNRNDIIKTVNMTPALIRKVVAPSMLYKSPPIISPMILARLAKLFATP